MSVKLTKQKKPMSVHLLHGEHKDGSSDVLDAFSTLEKAERAFRAAEKAHEDSPYWGYDSYSISEHKIL